MHATEDAVKTREKLEPDTPLRLKFEYVQTVMPKMAQYLGDKQKPSFLKVIDSVSEPEKIDEDNIFSEDEEEIQDESQTA